MDGNIRVTLAYIRYSLRGCYDVERDDALWLFFFHYIYGVVQRSSGR